MMFQNRRSGFRSMRNAAFGLVIVGSMLLAACGDDDSTPTPAPAPAAPAATVQVSTPTPAAEAPTRVAFDMHDFAFSVPESIPAGWVEFAATNSGAEPHHAIIAKLKDDVTLDAFNAAMESDPEAGFSLIDMAGGIPDVGPGGSQRAILNLAEGEYIAVCFIAGEDGVPHVAKGMQASFTVTPSSVEQAQPRADLTIDMHDFAYTMPDEIDAGHLSILVQNTGQQPHEMIIFKLDEGATVDDLIEFAEESESGPPSGPPPGQQIGGAYPIAGGGQMVLELHLEAGNYVGVCFIPDPETGQSHLALGMIAEFSVK